MLLRKLKKALKWSNALQGTNAVLIVNGGSIFPLISVIIAKHINQRFPRNQREYKIILNLALEF